ncbi:MAG TPA: hypothetical protein VK949_01845 [Methylotenera sp.]|nr:hypothetical protein [Methylotenera sp.]
MECWLEHFSFIAMVRLSGKTFATTTVRFVRREANGKTNNASPMQ